MHNSTTTRLLTLLNVSATKISKRKRDEEDAFVPAEKLNKRKSISFSETVSVKEISDKETTPKGDSMEIEMEVVAEVEEEVLEEVDGEAGDTGDEYERHFGPASSVLTESLRSAVERNAWKASKEKYGKLGSATVAVPEGAEANTSIEPSKFDVRSTTDLLFLH
ncbi:hypothetical protein BDQ12DRAFT_4121 [Crucibulum laeve]|uniref:Uncharacterized protein n=1 Tax=Crucibulum laeve TaxID=68775 RepID=A0A5C3MS31_9AGAR|nr:hypothetical protein BDQ12DRAFT_4121 [Crucibulum laeve]